MFSPEAVPPVEAQVSARIVKERVVKESWVRVENVG